MLAESDALSRQGLICSSRRFYQRFVVMFFCTLLVPIQPPLVKNLPATTLPVIGISLKPQQFILLGLFLW